MTDRAEPRVRNFGFSRRAWERVQFLTTSNGWPARLAQRLGGASGIRAESHTIAIDGLPAAPPLRIAFASDFHAGPTTHPSLLRAACDALRQAEPDVLLLGGDFVCLDARYINPLAEMLADVPAPFGRYAVFGNHDLWTDYRHLERQLERAGVQLLTNRNVRLADPFGHAYVCGLDDHMCGHPDGAAALSGADEVRIILMHAPSGLLDLRGAEFDLAFSGHVHGGQIALPNGRPIVVPPGKLSRRFSHGSHRLWNGGTLIVSRGVGCSTVPFRAYSPPEIVLCELRCGEASAALEREALEAIAS